jgi:transposase-like protein
MCPEVKTEAVRLVVDEGLTRAQAASDLGVGAKLLSGCVRAAKSREMAPSQGTESARSELSRLPRESRVRWMERDIPKKRRSLLRPRDPELTDPFIASKKAVRPVRRWPPTPKSVVDASLSRLPRPRESGVQREAPAARAFWQVDERSEHNKRCIRGVVRRHASCAGVAGPLREGAAVAVDLEQHA